ncbi:MAG: hypothetical protein RSE12_16980 [Fuscovulum sp.]|nr:MAG: hypothetical protein RSE12_16980 [Fuscovulum sp.]
MITKGKYRVGVSFNPSKSNIVDDIKTAAADLIDLIEGIDLLVPCDAGSTRQGEVARLKSLAQTAIEEGAMWAVKAATKPDPHQK